MATTIGEIQLLAKIDTSQYHRGAEEIDRANRKMEDSGSKTSSSLNTGFTRVANVGMAAVGAAAIAVGALLVSNIDSAIKRVDTLNNSARTFENMGFAAGDVSKSMESLKNSILGLPTPLDEAVRGMSLIAASTGDIGKSQKIFSSLNNAILGFGGSTEMVSNAVVQLSQDLAGGRVTGQTWMSLLNSGLGPALNAIAKSMGITTQALRDGLSDGTIAVDTFTEQLIKMNEQGGGGMKSFEQIAKDSTKGIGSAWSNMQTAITRGIANIIESVGSEKVATAITNIGVFFEKALTAVSGFLTYLAGNEAVIYAVGGAISGVLVAGVVALTVAMWNLMAPMLPVIAAFAAIGFAAYLIKDNWDKLKPTVDLVTGAFMAFWELIKPIREFIVTQFITAWNQLRASFDSMMTSLQPFIPQLKILGVIIGVVVVAPLVLLIATIGVAIAIIVAVITVVARLIGWLSMLQAAFLEVTGNIQNAVNSRIGAVINFFREVPGRIMNALGNLGSLLYNAGRDIVNGLKNGISDAINGLMDTVKGMAGKVSGAFKSALGIKSHSKVFAGFGENITEGLVSGINKGSGLIEGAVAGMTASTISPAVSVLDSDGGGGGGPSVVVNVKLDGIMTRSKADERSIAKGLVESINQELRAKQLPEIGGGALRGATP